MSGASSEISVAFRYALIGVLNTVIGYFVFWLMLVAFHLSPSISNALGYAVALTVAFYLNRSYVFDVKVYAISHYVKFVASFFGAFGLNQLVLWWLVYSEGWQPEFAQIAAMICYTVVFYLLNRFFVYRQ